MDEIGIRDLSRSPPPEWTPPIGAMGGPPAHELYRDLVRYAELRLLQNHDGRPCVAMRDGEHRRTFCVPSDELREALDRFRMRRSLRPLPEHELAEFTRVIEARASDPDILVPSCDVGDSYPRGVREVTRPRENDGEPEPRRIPPPPPTPGPVGWVEKLDSILREVDEVRRPVPSPILVAKVPSAWNDVVHYSETAPPAVVPAKDSISGARAASGSADGLPRYLRVLRTLVQEGGWLGTTSELSSLTGDSPERVFARLRAYRSDLADSNIVVVPVETEEGWRWMAVDRNRLNSTR